MKRKDFINISSSALGIASMSGMNSFGSIKPINFNDSMKFKDSRSAIWEPISIQERKDRIKKAQVLLKSSNCFALVLDCGTSLEYFTGISWFPSERPMVTIIPLEGVIAHICPAFEETRLSELTKIESQIIPWQEDENPFDKIRQVFLQCGIKTGKIGVEERTRFFILDGMKKSCPQLEFQSGESITLPCRLIKSQSEIKLMIHANEITIQAMKLGIQSLKEGISSQSISEIVNESHIKLGTEPDFALCSFGAASTMPHGSNKPQKLKKGDLVLLDCGSKFEGYCSDITRTIVFGAEPSQKQKQVWDLEKKAQQAGFIAAQLGNYCEEVDKASRDVIIDGGFGPGYQVPGLPHRTGHGIGMDGHEWGNMVKGNKLPLQIGMCFSIEPTIIIPGEFGIRLEDCVYMTKDGPKWFSEPSPSIGQPFV